MKDVMIDLETFGTGPNACISQIGAVYFDPCTGSIGKQFKVNVDARSHVKRGGIIDADTVYWWLQQSQEARESLLTDRADIDYAMNELNTFLEGADRIWSHATFDFVIITNTMKQLGIKPFFSYRAGLDIRTLLHLSGVNPKDFIRDGTQHDGLEDSKFQVKYVVAALNCLKG